MEQLPYKNYKDIPPIIKEVIKSVTGEKDIHNVPLQDINDYMQGVLDFDKDKVITEFLDEDEDSGGWVL